MKTQPQKGTKNANREPAPLAPSCGQPHPLITASDGLVFVRLPHLATGANLTIEAAELLLDQLDRAIEEAKTQRRFQNCMDGAQHAIQEE